MQMLIFLQGMIHKLETAQGVRYLKILLLILLAVSLLIRFDMHSARNMAAPDAMDSAQLARNLSEGKGYTTEFIRPLSIYMVRQMNHDAGDKDPAGLNANHPDISNPPIYPVVLAGLMKVLPFHFDSAAKGSFWSLPDPNNPGGQRGIRYQPDFLITFFNQFLFFLIVALTFFWARRLYEFSVARTSAIVLLLSEALWRFSASGLSTMLLLLLFMVLVWCLTLWESEVREPKWGAKGAILLSAAVGVLLGIGGLTRYSFLSMIFPVGLFLAIFGGPRRWICTIAAILAAVAIVSPWIARNYAVSGSAFGTAGYSVIEWFFPGFRLQRSLQPVLPGFPVSLYFKKFMANLGPTLQGDFINDAGGLIMAFFLVGLLVGFRSQSLRRMRYFAVGSLVMLIIAQALALTKFSEESPEINSENLLVLISPLVVVFGVGLFYSLLDGIAFPASWLRRVAISGFVFLIRVPMWFSLLLPGKGPIVYPPYWPDRIQSTARVLHTNEMMMTDIPWATAWYGDRQSVWLTLNAAADPQKPTEWQESFFAINDVLKPIHVLYLTPRSLDARFQSDWIRGNDASWGYFITDAILNGKLSAAFPLTKMVPGYLPDQILLYDGER
jgi:hypothetical protein